ncbi:ExbD/TolR family protein [Roseibium sediminicola]|uniref:Biopolymer transporter ExbD n=1 Tax=Roseibium sediminicola TaxID=2933272 RepID=A0ABT0GXH0_9HYPH|nr:biopolymer transporter ExbD [Roseibium sp. CAU 1639]MCK7613752.1 biopolymer transporter ExbD [Roseibium sp. CAU 1639]
MRLTPPQHREPPENTIPLINVVFLMLIFFLFAGSLARDDARKVEPPLNILEDETIRATGALVVDKDGRTFAGDAEMSVGSWLAQKDGAETGSLKLAADGDLRADLLEKVLNELKAAGRTDIVLITRRGAP